MFASFVFTGRQKETVDDQSTRLFESLCEVWMQVLIWANAFGLTPNMILPRLTHSNATRMSDLLQ